MSSKLPSNHNKSSLSTSQNFVSIQRLSKNTQPNSYDFKSKIISRPTKAPPKIKSTIRGNIENLLGEDITKNKSIEIIDDNSKTKVVNFIKELDLSTSKILSNDIQYNHNDQKDTNSLLESPLASVLDHSTKRVSLMTNDNADDSKLRNKKSSSFSNEKLKNSKKSNEISARMSMIVNNAKENSPGKMTNSLKEKKMFNFTDKDKSIMSTPNNSFIKDKNMNNETRNSLEGLKYY